MHRSTILTVVIICVAGAVYFMTRDESDPGGFDLESMARDQAQRETLAESLALQEKSNLDILASKGLGLAVPPHLRTSTHPTENYWFVGMPSGELRAQVPFKPGGLPAAPSQADPVRPNPGFLGAAACKSCHEETYESFIQTAHYQTSRLATAENISGSFDPGRNQMQTHSADVFFTMLQRDGDCFQRASFFDWKFDVPFHLIMGSSKMGESYLYWHGDRLF